jgi:hypothetical protein
MVAHRPSKPFVAGSNPVSRSHLDGVWSGSPYAKSSWNRQELFACLEELLVDRLGFLWRKQR